MKARSWLAAGIAIYALLLGLIYLYLSPPWNYLAVALLGFKALMFWGIMRQASTIGRKGRVPPK